MEASKTMMKWRQWRGLFEKAIGGSRGVGTTWNPLTIDLEGISQNQNWQVCKAKHIASNFNFLLSMLIVLLIAFKKFV